MDTPEQLYKLINTKPTDVYPKTLISSISENGITLSEILQKLNSYFVGWKDSKENTRLSIPMQYRKRGLWLTYEDSTKNLISEWYDGASLVDEEFKKDSNWKNRFVVGLVQTTGNSETDAMSQYAVTKEINRIDKYIQNTKTEEFYAIVDIDPNYQPDLYSNPNIGETVYNKRDNRFIVSVDGIDGPYYDELARIDEVIARFPLVAKRVPRLGILYTSQNKVYVGAHNKLELIPNIVNDLGNNEEAVINQKIVTEHINSINTKIDKSTNAINEINLYWYSGNLKGALTTLETYLQTIQKDINKGFKLTFENELGTLVTYEFQIDGVLLDEASWKIIPTIIVNNRGISEEKVISQKGITDIVTDLQNQDELLQNQIDTIISKSDVSGIVQRYAKDTPAKNNSLEEFNTRTITINDIIKVLKDESKDNSISYYQWLGTTTTSDWKLDWKFIGKLGEYYTKSESNELFNTKIDISRIKQELNNGNGSENNLVSQQVITNEFNNKLGNTETAADSDKLGGISSEEWSNSIADKQSKTDNGLNTTSKEIVGAINELDSGKQPKGDYPIMSESVPTEPTEAFPYVRYNEQNLTSEQQKQVQENVFKGGPNRKLYENTIGVKFNENTNYYIYEDLILDLTEFDVQKIYQNWNLFNSDNIKFFGAFIRDVRIINFSTQRLMAEAGYAGVTKLSLEANGALSRSKVEVIVGIGTSGRYEVFYSVNRMFEDDKNLKSIIPILNFYNIKSAVNTFKGCFSLVSIKLNNLTLGISFADSPNLSKDSILYMIQNATPSGKITITLHPTAYAMAMADNDIQAALEAQPNVGLLSA